MKYLLFLLPLLVMALPEEGAGYVSWVTYPVHFVAVYQAKGAIGAVPSDLVIVMASSTYTRTINNFFGGSSFTVQVAEPPRYQWWLKGLWHLATGGTDAGAEIDAGLQRVGDTPDVAGYSGPPCPWVECWRYEAGDNVVESLDFSRLRAWFGVERPCCPPDIMRYDAADFSGDGLVDVLDFSLMQPNFGMSGAPHP